MKNSSVRFYSLCERMFLGRTSKHATTSTALMIDAQSVCGCSDTSSPAKDS